MPQVTDFASFVDVIGRWIPVDLVRAKRNGSGPTWEGPPAGPDAPASVSLRDEGTGNVVVSFRTADGRVSAPSELTFPIDGSSLLDVVNAIRHRFGFDTLED